MFTNVTLIFESNAITITFLNPSPTDQPSSTNHHRPTDLASEDGDAFEALSAAHINICSQSEKSNLSDWAKWTIYK